MNLTLAPEHRDAVAAFSTMLEAENRRRIERGADYDDPTALRRVWDGLVDGGWLEAGAAGADSAFLGFRTLIDLAEHWGTHLFGLPFVEGLLVRRWAQAPLPDADRVTFLIPASGAIAPFGRTARPVDSTTFRPLNPADYDVEAEDDFAPSLPTAVIRVRAERPPLAPEYCREAAILLAAVAAGSAAHCLELAIEWASEREAYGRVIGRFQAIQHLLADMCRDLELARSGIIGSQGDDGWPELLRMSTSLTRKVVEGSIQVHGGVGFTWELGIHRYMRHCIVVNRLAFLLGEAAR